MKGLTGAQAVERLERRGGQVAVFRRGTGTWFVFDCVGRDQGRAVVAPHSPNSAPGGGRILASDSDRAALAREMDEERDRANAGWGTDASGYVLVHRDILATDAGYAQVGCFLALFSVVVGLILGLIIGWIATSEVKGDALLVGPVVGFVVGFFGTEVVARIAVYIPPLRDRLETVAYAWTAIVPGVLTAATIIVMTMSSSTPG
jgi:uncharacterized membrane protein YeaQ/YmgE (transglycosylase-associated protein family)